MAVLEIGTPLIPMEFVEKLLLNLGGGRGNLVW